MVTLMKPGFEKLKKVYRQVGEEFGVHDELFESTWTNRSSDSKVEVNYASKTVESKREGEDGSEYDSRVLRLTVTILDNDDGGEFEGYASPERAAIKDTGVYRLMFEYLDDETDTSTGYLSFDTDGRIVSVIESDNETAKRFLESVIGRERVLEPAVRVLMRMYIQGADVVLGQSHEEAPTEPPEGHA